MLTAWHDVYIHSVMKRFQMARAQALFRNQLEQRALLCWQSYAKAQARKAFMQSAAAQFLWYAMNYLSHALVPVYACLYKLAYDQNDRNQLLSKVDAICNAPFHPFISMTFEAFGKSCYSCTLQ